MQVDLLSLLAHAGIAAAPEHAQLDTLGLNHLTWYRGLTIDGEDLWPRVLELYLADLHKQAAPEWTPDLIAALRMIPNYYLHYFYATGRKLAEQAAWPPSRAEQVMAIEEQLFAQYADPQRSVPPAGLMQRGGAHYSTVATQLINSHYNDLGEQHIVNIAHGGAVTGWPADWVLELPATVGRAGITPLPADPLPPAVFGLMQQVKQYELLTVQAAVHGDRTAAYQALLAHPLGPAADQVAAVLDDMLTTHRAYLPQFFSD
jgi:6-phospho-beta-glucosidase